MYCHFFLEPKKTRLLTKRYSASYNFSMWIGCISEHLTNKLILLTLRMKLLVMALSLCERITCATPDKTEIPWWYDSIKKGMDIVIHDVSKMPEEAKSEQHLLILQEVSSLLIIPIFKQGKPSGFIGFDSVKKKRNWSALDIENLHMLADILSIAIERGGSPRISRTYGYASHEKRDEV